MAMSMLRVSSSMELGIGWRRHIDALLIVNVCEGGKIIW